jgi:hypothetical protein
MTTDAMSNLLDLELDDLADLPAFEIFRPGAHRVAISFAEKKIGEHPAVELKLRLIETLELSNSADTPNEPGTETSVAFMLDNEYGVGNFKEILKPLSAATGASKPRAIMEAAKDMVVAIVTTVRPDKNDKDKLYMQIKTLIVE